MGGTALDPQRVTLVKPRSYLHFDLPLSDDERAAYSISPDEVAARSFWPLLGFSQVERRIQFNDLVPWEISSKERPIRYASHRDAAIYSTYAEALGSAYEQDLKARGLDKSVLAYRTGVGSNVHFAKDLFDEIRVRGDCVVLCMDISKFFDHLKHDFLDKRLRRVLGVPKLPRDWIAIFKRLTKYEYVDKVDIEKAIGRSSERGKVCGRNQFHRHVRKIIRKHKMNYGIPQGSPLSGIFANIYMTDFDQKFHRYLSEIGGTYRRYSDDIAIVLPSHASIDLVEMVANVMMAHEGLSINPSKTTVTKFSKVPSGLTFIGNELQYLGFTFDGRRVLLRPSSLKRFYAKMKGSIRIAVRAAKDAGYPKDQIRRRSLVGRFTHLGDSRNFVQYAYRASRIMGEPSIRRQLRRHTKIFADTLARNVDRYYR